MRIRVYAIFKDDISKTLTRYGRVFKELDSALKLASRFKNYYITKENSNGREEVISHHGVFDVRGGTSHLSFPSTYTKSCHMARPGTTLSPRQSQIQDSSASLLTKESSVSILSKDALSVYKLGVFNVQPLSGNRR